MDFLILFFLLVLEVMGCVLIALAICVLIKALKGGL